MALTSAERRFLRSWQDQRSGGKTKFLLIYIFGLFIAFIAGIMAIGFLASVSQVKISYILPSILISLSLAIFFSIYIWVTNERKYKFIINREIKQQD